MPVERIDLGKIDNPDSDILIDEHWLRYRYVAEYITTGKILDVACGTGYGSYFLAMDSGLDITAVDVSEEMIAKAKEKYNKANLKYQAADALSLPFADNSFDQVVSFETIEHFSADNQKLFLKELKRVLKPEGRLWISTPNSKATKHKNPWHLKELNYHEFTDIMSKNFRDYRIIMQGTSLATVICSDRMDSHRAIVDLSSQLSPKYLLAVASDEDLDVDLDKIAVSLNPQAFKRLDNHPLKQISDLIYHPVSQFIKKLRGKRY
jgi:2-polyprenyl-3-methyl-5-hydroxy-6-metoxy-1,4-benzoquinol methylase